MVVNQNEKVLAERSYYSASECVEKIGKAFEYYTEKGEKVEIIMLDNRKYLIIKIDTLCA